MNSTFGKILLGLIILVVAVIGIIYVYKTITIKNTNETDYSANIKQGENNLKEYSIGDTIYGSDWKFAVLKFEEGEKYDQRCKPEVGHKFVYLDCFYENTSNEIINGNTYLWKLVDENGGEYTGIICIDGAKEPVYQPDKLYPGKKRRGFEPFQVPNDSKKFEFYFNPEFMDLNGNQYIVKLN